MSTKIFEAKTVEEALAEAATALDADPEELRHEVVEEKSDDFWGLGETVLAVRVWIEGEEAPTPEEAEAPAAAPEPEPEATSAEAALRPDEAAEASASSPEVQAADAGDFFAAPEGAPAEPEPEVEPDTPEPETEAQPPAPAQKLAAEHAPEAASAAREAPAAASEPAGGADLGEEAVALLGRVFGAMGFDCDATARLDGDTLQVAITGDDNAYLLEGRGRGLSALELVLNHAFRHRDDRAHRRVRVDAGDFRNQREEELRDIAFQVAHQAKETGQPQQTGSLNPYERRIVHLTLADDATVTTRSLGNGFMKVVSVIPTRGGDRRR